MFENCKFFYVFGEIALVCNVRAYLEGIIQHKQETTCLISEKYFHGISTLLSKSYDTAALASAGMISWELNKYILTHLIL